MTGLQGAALVCFGIAVCSQLTIWVLELWKKRLQRQIRERKP